MPLLRLLWPCLLLSLCLGTTVLADDGAYYSGEPRFTLERADVLVPEAVHIKLANMAMRVAYTLANPGDTSISSTLRFDMPEDMYRGPGDWYPQRAHPELALTFGGKELPYSRESRAWFENTEVSATLALYGLKPEDAANVEFWTDNMSPELSQKLRPLRQLGLLSNSNLPQWTASTTCHAAFTLPPGARAEFAYTYRMQPGVTASDGKAENYPLFPLERLQEVGQTWQSLVGFYEQDSPPYQYYVIKWLRLPLGLHNWPQGLPLVAIALDVPPDEMGMPMLLALRWNGVKHLDKHKLNLEAQPFREAREPLCIIMRPYS